MSGQTILIVEDDPDIRDGVRILLAGEGYHILEAENGLRALELFNPEVDPCHSGHHDARHERPARV